MQITKLDEQENKFLKNFFLLIFFYILLEGGVRKWFLPNFRTEITLIKDIIIIWGILYSFNRGIYKRLDWQKNVIFLWTLLVIFWICVQMVMIENDNRIYLVGFRNWVLYFWFSLMFVNAFNKDILDQISRIILLTIIPMGLLSIAQHFLPVEHVLNAQSGLKEVEEYIFQVVFGIVRTTGTFSFVLGHTMYMYFITPFFLYFIDGSHKNVFSKKIKFLIVFCYFCAVLVSGSRATIVYCAFMYSMYLFYIAKNRKIKNIVPYLFWLLTLAIVALIFFQGAIDATFTRFVGSAEVESFGGRIFETIIGSDRAWQIFTFFGYGIGVTSNLSEFIGGVGFDLGEWEVDRILAEGGIVGLLFFLFKILFSIIVLFKSYSLSRISNNILPFFFALFIVIQIMTAQITGQITVHGFTFLGLALLFSMLTINFDLKK
tara:strand:- start:1086 stop:2378 length:1293 start_codon:yes stop_codon:yes gene_type:complete